MLKINWPWAKPKDNYLVLIIFILISELTGIIGTIFTLPAISSWYIYLNKPIFSPPNWLFGPVWSLLYVLIAVSGYLVWRKYQFGKKAKSFWSNFLIQMILNFAWTPIFFGLKWILVALVVIVVMWYYIYKTINSAKTLVPSSALLLYPYLAWVSFATLLNFAIVVLN